VLLSTAAAATCAMFGDARRNLDNACFHKQPPGILQQSSDWCMRRFTEETAVSLDWLPTHENWTTSHLVYKCLRGPSYLSQPVSSLLGHRQLRTGTTGILSIQRTKTSNGSRSSAVTAMVQSHGTVSRWSENTWTVCSVCCQAFEVISLQQLLTEACWYLISNLRSV